MFSELEKTNRIIPKYFQVTKRKDCVAKYKNGFFSMRGVHFPKKGAHFLREKVLFEDKALGILVVASFMPQSIGIQLTSNSCQARKLILRQVSPPLSFFFSI